MTARKKEFSPGDIAALEPTEKVALVATINPEGLPHVSLITSLQALDPAHLVLGEFSRGTSKDHMRRNNSIGFLIMTLDRMLWRGTARWTHLKKEGPEYRMMNEKPMFRYNTYFGINTVHYFDLVETTERQGLPLGSIAVSALKTAYARRGARTGISEQILNPFAMTIVDRIDSLKFLSYIGGDGYPVIVPLLQCRAADPRRLAFAPAPFGGDLSAVPAGATVAVFAMTMRMEDILIRGTYNGVGRYRGVRLGTVDINWVYNSMPPVHGQIYPEIGLKPVSNF